MVKRLGVLLTAAAASAGVMVSMTGAGATAKNVLTAQLAPYTTAHAGVITDSGVTGQAHFTATGAGTTIVTIEAAGLKPGDSYGAHVHFGTCPQFLGHFKFDTSIASARRANEVWLDLTANADGRARDQVSVAGIAPDQVLSVVIHHESNPDLAPNVAGETQPGARIACGELLPAGS